MGSIETHIDLNQFKKKTPKSGLTENLSMLTYTRRHHSLVVIGVDTHIVTLEVKGKLAVFDMLQFILMQVRPPPQPGIDDMREPFTSSHLVNNNNREAEYRERVN